MSRWLTVAAWALLSGCSEGEPVAPAVVAPDSTLHVIVTVPNDTRAIFRMAEELGVMPHCYAVDVVFGEPTPLVTFRCWTVR